MKIILTFWRSTSSSLRMSHFKKLLSIHIIFHQQIEAWLVVGPPLWKIWKSIGMIINPILMGKFKIDGNQNHQPEAKGT